MGTSPVWVICRRHFSDRCRRTAPARGWNAEGGQMHSIRIIGPGRAGTSLAAALSAAAGSSPGSAGATTTCRTPPRASTSSSSPRPTTSSRRWRPRSHPARGDHRGAPLGVARARRAGAAPPPGRRAPARAPAQRRGRCGPPVLGRHLRGGRRAGGARDRRVPRRPGGRGGRRRPRRVPRRRLHRGQPRRGAARAGRTGGGDGRAWTSSRSCRSPGPRSTTSPRSAPRAALDRPGPRGATGPRSAATSTRCPRRAAGYQAGAALATRLPAASDAACRPPSRPAPAAV